MNKEELKNYILSQVANNLEFDINELNLKKVVYDYHNQKIIIDDKIEIKISVKEIKGDEEENE